MPFIVRSASTTKTFPLITMKMPRKLVNNFIIQPPKEISIHWLARYLFDYMFTTSNPFITMKYPSNEKKRKIEDPTETA